MLKRIIRRLRPQNPLKDRVAYEGVRLDVSSQYISREMKRHLNTSYEAQELGLLKKHLESRHRVLELGAGLGLLGIFAVKQVGVVEYVGVEADPNLVGIIRTNATLNGVELNILNAAVGPKNGVASFNLSSRFWANSLLPRDSTVRTIEVRSLTIKELYRQLSFVPDFVIIDVEGAEELLSLQELAPAKSILIELHPFLIGAERTAGVINALFDAGYRLCDYQGDVFLFRS